MLWKSLVETIMDEIDSYIYVADYETNELIYMNSAARKRYGKDENDMSFLGKKCYEVIQHKDERCSFCKRDSLNERNFCQWYNYNEYLGQHFYNRDKIIKIEGRSYHIQISRLEDEHMEQKRKLEQQLEIERKLVKCAKTLNSELPVQEAIESLLQIVANFYNADRAYIFEVNMVRQTTSNTYEWVAEGITKEIDNLQNMPLYLIHGWLEAFERNGAFYMTSDDKNINVGAETYQILENQNIQSLMAVPLVDKDVIVGFLGLDNPRRNYDDFTLLNSVTYFLQNDLEKRKVYGKLERMSFQDSMTGLSNRNKYNQTMAELSEKVPQSLGIIYMDLNGLKKLNDEEGHEQGDLLLKRTGKILYELFGLDAYRVGGDEFVIILAEISGDLFTDGLEHLRETMKQQQIDIAVGESWREYNVNITEQMHKADKLMYIEKMRHYEMQHD